MDNRISEGYEKFEKLNQPILGSRLFPYAAGFKDGVESEKERIKKRLKEYLRPHIEKVIPLSENFKCPDSVIDWVEVALDDLVNRVVESDG